MTTPYKPSTMSSSTTRKPAIDLRDKPIAAPAKDAPAKVEPTGDQVRVDATPLPTPDGDARKDALKGIDKVNSPQAETKR